MKAIKKFRNPQALAALLTALGLLLGGSLGGVARAQAPAKAKSQVEAKAPYKSSIQVPNDNKGKREEAEGKEAHKGHKAHRTHKAREQAEAARYQNLARITADQARDAALAKVPGTAESVELENEDGNLVYGVTVKTTAGAREVKVDAGNGTVLHVEQDERD